ncbi:MAG: CapA family protein [bacterium]
MRVTLAALICGVVLTACTLCTSSFQARAEINWNNSLPVDSTTISLEGPHIRIAWPDVVEGQGLFLLFFSREPNFEPGRATLLGATQRSYYVDPLSISRQERAFYRVAKLPQGIVYVMDEVMIEDFEDGQVTLTSYPGEDQDPNDWEITSIETYGGTLFSLMLYGNTWKVEAIPPVAVTAGTVWRAAVMADEPGEVHAFGVGDGVNEMKYVFGGTQLMTTSSWNTTYQGVASLGNWAEINLPIGRDWLIQYGTLPVITRLFYINDKDAGSQNSVSFYDEIHDITEDLPSIPQVFITVQGDSSQPSPFYSFTSMVIDPDSPTHSYFWDFGDSTFSNQPNPSHTYSTQSYRTVSLMVMDDDSLFGDAVVHLLPPPGTPAPEFTLNNAGDVMLARRYEEPGGIIPTYGVNYIFERTRNIFGLAADISMINLECPLTDEGYPHPTKDYIFRGSPENVTGLVYAGFNYVALGNNHTTDYMEPGLLETIAVLHDAGLLFSGSGMTDYWATRPAFFTQNGIRVAVLSYCNRDGREDFLPPFLEAGYNKAGFAMFDEPTLEATIPIADSLADLVILQVHAGTEYDPSPADRLSSETLQLPPEEYLHFSTRIDSVDRYLKQRAIQLGADLVLCHHPHVIQGYEVYQGKLIAHSFGNFAFDQNYWETYLSMILYSRATLDGFMDMTFRPVYIDDYVPTEATGELRESILRKMAAYSTELETDIVYDSTTGLGTIVLDPGSIQAIPRNVQKTLTFTSSGGYYVSEPIRVEDPGFLSAIVSLTGMPGGAQIQASLGNEVLYMGGFEYEGGWLWYLNNDDEFLETMYPHSGTYCLAVRRSGGQSTIYTDLEDRIPMKPDYRYTLDGYIAGSNANNACFGLAYYEGRLSGDSFQQEYSSEQDGTFSWSRFRKEVDPPNNANFVNVRCRNSGPSSSNGLAFFDDLALIEWKTDWTTISTGTTPIDYPNETTYLQIRCNQAVSTANLTYRMTVRQVR